MNKYHLKYLTVFALMLFSLVQLNAQKLPMIELKKGACKGQCPVYAIEIDQKGLLYYHGIAHVEMKGKWSRQLRKKELRKVKRLLKRAKMMKLDDHYDKNIMDASRTTLTFRHKKIDKTVVANLFLPEPLLKAEKYIISLMNEQNPKHPWIEEKTPALQEPGRKESMEKTMIIELKEETNPNQWQKKYYKSELEYYKKIAPNQNLFLFRILTPESKIPSLLESLKTNKNVINAELNKKIELRKN